MSWASRRRTAYGAGVFLFFLVVIGGPIAYHFLTIAATCFDGVQNQGETAVDKGGPCAILDEHYLAPSATLWARSFRTRGGLTASSTYATSTYNAVAYIQNPNKDAGVRAAHYHFGLYDDSNVLVAEREGVIFIMPGSVTPVFEGGIVAGNRVVAHTYFDFTEPLTWERMANTASAVEVADKVIANIGTVPRVSASVTNTSVAPLRDITLTAVVFDPAGDAFAASETAVTALSPGETRAVVFTWPDPFHIPVGSVDIIPVIAPTPVRAAR